MENPKQKTLFEMMTKCDEIINNYGNLKEDGAPAGLDEAKTVLNAIGKKQKLIAVQLEYCHLTGVKVNNKDFDFVYKASK